MQFQTTARLLRLPLLLLCLSFFCPAASAAPVVTFTPALVVAGAPELIRVQAPGALGIQGIWMGRKIDFFRSRDGRSWLALAGADAQDPIGPSHLQISIMVSPDDVTTIDRNVVVHPASYRTSTLTVDPKFVEPPPDAQARIQAEGEVKHKIYAASAPQPLWTGSFRAPVRARQTESFGTRRMFNGKLSSVHLGTDFRAPAGTVVRASNSGIVALARPLYYEGNCVILDHGLGLFTLSMHLSRIDVKEGQHVAAGQPLGLSGATGRVTGPHLHWAVRWQGANLDPVKLLRMKLEAAR